MYSQFYKEIIFVRFLYSLEVYLPYKKSLSSSPLGGKKKQADTQSADICQQVYPVENIYSDNVKMVASYY